MIDEKTIKQIVKRERESFSAEHWNQRFLEAQIYRMSCGWEEKAQAARRIRKNELPLTEMKSLPGYKGKHYVDNWIWKSVKMLTSMLAGASMDLDVKSYLNEDGGPGELVEMELNWAAKMFRMQETADPALIERYFPGMGYIRAVWNTRKITPNYPTGTPIFEPVNSFDIWLDPGIVQPDRSDMRYIFHQKWHDVEYLKKAYPKFGEKIAAQSNEERTVWTNQVRVLTIQYRPIVIDEVVIVEDRNTGKKREFPLHEWMEMVRDAQADANNSSAWQSQAMERQERGEPVEDYEDWLSQGKFLPEMIHVNGPIEIERDVVMQAIYLPDQSLLLQEPEYVGERFSYFILQGIAQPDSPYAIGLASMQADALEEDIILMTSLVLQAAKMHRNKELIQQNSLVNQEQYQKHGHELNVQPIVSEQWQADHEGTKAVDPIPVPDFPRALMLLSDRLVQNQKTYSGAVDAMMGMQSSSGQSGIQVAQLQTAARTYLRDDIESYRRFLQDMGTWLKDQIVKYRNFEHQIPGLREDNTTGMVDVAKDMHTRLDLDDYYVEVSLQDNQEVVKQIERDFYRYLVERGFITPLSFMRKTDVPNPEKELKDRQEWDGVQEAIEILQTIPGAAEYLTQYAQQYQSQMAAGGVNGGGPIQAQPQ